jgi:hypothetical protein
MICTKLAGEFQAVIGVKLPFTEPEFLLPVASIATSRSRMQKPIAGRTSVRGRRCKVHLRSRAWM